MSPNVIRHFYFKRHISQKLNATRNIFHRIKKKEECQARQHNLNPLQARHCLQQRFPEPCCSIDHLLQYFGIAVRDGSSRLHMMVHTEEGRTSFVRLTLWTTAAGISGRSEVTMTPIYSNILRKNRPPPPVFRGGICNNG